MPRWPRSRRNRGAGEYTPAPAAPRPSPHSLQPSPEDPTRSWRSCRAVRARYPSSVLIAASPLAAAGARAEPADRRTGQQWHRRRAVHR
ncbi:hypothetical protein G6F50_016847 [Rhizopus delemar]|uniref:Uncharacterized protein n=1 Tax=Rhizopus delemar TaxID=936053 RepID=A0A9P6XSR6_9FUNG|nr:hypothetical protein G6F50_016847 [Rhizopus delemar]